MLLWGRCPWSLTVFTLPFPCHCRAPAPWVWGLDSWGMGMGTPALNWHRAFLGAALPCRQPWVGEGCHVLRAVPRGMLCLEGLSHQTRLFLVLMLQPRKEHPCALHQSGAGSRSWALQTGSPFPSFPGKDSPFRCMPCLSLLCSLAG